ncbi:MAG: 50S ribosomal protein L22 [Candidatus Bathyarchaeia archaeon]
MPEWGYSARELDPERTVKCSGRELRISPKHAVEICRTIRGMRLGEAKSLLEAVIRKERPIAFRRYKKEVPHRDLPERWHSGRYPVKAAGEILRLLEGLESNAEYKGIDVERLKIIHAAAQRGMKVRRYIPRAFGRSTPSFETLTHVELIGYEIE